MSLEQIFSCSELARHIAAESQHDKIIRIGGHSACGMSFLAGELAFMLPGAITVRADHWLIRRDRRRTPCRSGASPSSYHLQRALIQLTHIKAGRCVTLPGYANTREVIDEQEVRLGPSDKCIAEGTIFSLGMFAALGERAYMLSPLNREEWISHAIDHACRTRAISTSIATQQVLEKLEDMDAIIRESRCVVSVGVTFRNGKPEYLRAK